MLIPLIPIDDRFKRQTAGAAVRMICEVYIRNIGGCLLPPRRYNLAVGSHADKPGMGPVRISAEFGAENIPTFVVSFTPADRIKMISNETLFMTILQLFCVFRRVWVRMHSDTRLVAPEDAFQYLTLEQKARINGYMEKKETYSSTMLDELIFMELILALLVLDIRTEEAGPELWAATISQPHNVLTSMLRLAQPGILTNFITTAP